jgi:hypothetical protein
VSSDLVTSLVELAVGLACLGTGILAWRHTPRRWAAIVLLVAGLAAGAHAGVALTG